MVFFLITNNNSDAMAIYSLPVSNVVNFRPLAFGEHFECQELFFWSSTL